MLVLCRAKGASFRGLAREAFAILEVTNSIML